MSSSPFLVPLIITVEELAKKEVVKIHQSNEALEVDVFNETFSTNHGILFKRCSTHKTYYSYKYCMLCIIPIATKIHNDATIRGK